MRHPNKRNFTGVLVFIDRPSDKLVSGAKRHKVLIPKSTAERALQSLIGMGVNFCEIGHDPRNKCGVITHAEIVEDRIEICGFIYEFNFPEVVNSLYASEEYGLSFETGESAILDMSAAIWTIVSTVFVGASILPKCIAAFQRTSIKLMEP